MRHTDTQRRYYGGPLSLLSLLKKESRQMELHNRTRLSHSGNFGSIVIVVRELHVTSGAHYILVRRNTRRVPSGLILAPDQYS